ncbi:hypothetical protein C479_06657 [Halovivax asiaticus JCM 14624]|uniref:Uncharacterized protein n=1 Tax=Halovivax asiaticus JCM 14624 TaxID=1227490 RepID=M0BLH6_9EURY|nr:DUF6498-containing protein [Halovivax asiaticus]ELZ11715.1 hypothetical protein C479_06657 [Halovivax asiaticus JCM 14624]
MHVVHWVGDDGRRAEVYAAVVTNLIPLLGILAFGWRAATLVTVYWFELAVVGFWAVVRALFAGRPSEFNREALLIGVLADRSAAIPLPRTDVRIQLSSLPVLVVITPMLCVLWFVAGLFSLGFVGERALEPAVVEVATYATLAFFCIEGGRTVIEYFHRGGYHESSAQTAVRPVFWRCCVLFFVGLTSGLIAGIVDPSVAHDEPLSAADPSIAGGLLVGCLVVAKLGADLVGIYRDRFAGFGDSLADSFGIDVETSTESPTVAHGDGFPEADRRIRPPLGGRLVATRAHWVRLPSAWTPGMFIALFAFLFALAGAWGVVVGLLVLAVLLSILLLHLDYWLRYWGVEYRIDGDSILAYDGLFGSPLWRIEAWDESDVRVERDWVDGRLGTTTVVVDLPDRTVRLPRVREPELILAVFDRPVDGLTVE